MAEDKAAKKADAPASDKHTHKVVFLDKYTWKRSGKYYQAKKDEVMNDLEDIYYANFKKLGIVKDA